MKLRGKKPLLRLLRMHEVDLVLHGHYHENSGYVRKGVRFLNGGGSVLGPNASELSFNIITVSRDGVRTDIQTIPAAAAGSRASLRPVSPKPALSRPAAA
jgi:predicted phosphodiesterase